MRAWVVRNRWALPVIVVMVGLILGTVTYPTWRKELGYLEPLLSTHQYRRPSRGIVVRRGLIARLLLRARDLN